MKISGFGEVFTYAQQRGSLTLTGCNNIVNLKGCQASIWIIGQGNIFNVVQCCLQVHFNGNDNILGVQRSQLSVGINGNKNKIQTTQQSQESQNSCKIAVLYENGYHNQVPPNIKLSSSHIIPSARQQTPYSFNAQPNNLRPTNSLNNYLRFQYFPQEQSHLLQWTSYQPTFKYNKMPRFNHFNYPNFHQAIQNPYSQFYKQNQRQNNGQNLNNCYGDNQASQYVRSRENIKEMQKMRNSYFINNRRMQQSSLQPFNRSRRMHYQPNVINSDDDWDIAMQIPRFDIPRVPRPLTRHYLNRNFFSVNENSEELSVGLTQTQINKLPICKYEGSNSKCSICLQDISKDNDVLFIFCFHSFHATCGINWFKKSVTCPICQIDVRSQLLKSQ